MSDSIISLFKLCMCLYMDEKKLKRHCKLQHVFRQDCSILRQGGCQLTKLSALYDRVFTCFSYPLEFTQSLMPLTQRQLKALGDVDVAVTLPLGILLMYGENYFEFL